MLSTITDISFPTTTLPGTDPAELIRFLEKERDTMLCEKRNLQLGLDKLIERTNDSIEVMLPSIAKDAKRYAQELAMARAELAKAMTLNADEASLAAISRRRDVLEREVQQTEELLAQAEQLLALLHELRDTAGLPGKPTHAITYPLQGAKTPLAAAENFFGIPPMRASSANHRDMSRVFATRTQASHTAESAPQTEDQSSVFHDATSRSSALSSGAAFASSLFGKLFRA